MNQNQKVELNKQTKIIGYKCTADGHNWAFSKNKKCRYCIEVKNVDCAHSGWWLVRFKNTLSKEKRNNDKICDTFEDFAFYNGVEWYVSEYEALGFYVYDVIREDNEN